jgi:Xaa-Pro dipeptidase
MGLKIFPKSEYDLRIRRAKELMERDSLDAIIAAHDKNFEYLTAGWRLGFDTIGYMADETLAPVRPGAMIVPLDGAPVALVPRLFTRTKERGWVDDVRDWYGLPFKIDYLMDELKEMGLSKAKIGMELGEEQHLFLSYVGVRKMMEEMSDTSFVASDIFWELRRRKTRAEADKIRRACEITGKALDEFFSVAEPNMKTRDVIRILFTLYMDHGATRPSFPPNLGLDLDAETLKTGKEYCFDTAAIVDGYTADICRAVVVGRATQQQRDLYDKCVQLNDTVRKASKEGVRTRDVWNVYIETLKELDASGAGSWRSTPDRIGHGFGLMGNEPPTLGPNDVHVLEAGNVHCVEPGLGTATEYFYIEENVWVTESGSELLSSSVPRELWEI